MLDMPTASHELTAALISVLHNVALGSVDGCVLMLQGGIAMAAAMLLTSNGTHDDQQDARMAAVIQQICMKVPQAEVWENYLTRIGIAVWAGSYDAMPCVEAQRLLGMSAEQHRQSRCSVRSHHDSSWAG